MRDTRPLWLLDVQNGAKFEFSFIFFPIYLCATSSLIYKKGQELKQNNWKYLRDLTRTRVTKISRISWMRHFPVNWFFTVKGNLFSFMARISIPTVLRGHQCNYTETLPMYRQCKPPSFSTYSCERLNFPLQKLDHIRWPSYVKGYSFLDGSLLRQRTYLEEKNCLYRTINNICYPGKGTIRRCMCHFVFLPVA